MAVFRNVAQPMWQMDCWGFSGRADRNLRDLSHASALVFAFVALATGILAGISLFSNFGIGMTATFIFVVVLFPVICGWLAKERWRAKKLEAHVNAQLKASGLRVGSVESRDDTPAGIIIVSPDMTIRFANQMFLKKTLQEPEEILGLKIQDVLLAEGLEDHLKELMEIPNPAGSCCFNAFIRIGLTGDQPLRITMVRITPKQSEDRVLVVVEDLLPGYPPRAGLPVEGYVC